MEYLIRFVQTHETFRRPETEAIAELYGLPLEWVLYDEDSPFALLRFPTHPNPAHAARLLISRSILSTAIYELWGSGPTYPTLHTDVRHRTTPFWHQYSTVPFRFELDTYRGHHRSAGAQREIFDSFAYMAFRGPISLADPEVRFRVFESSPLDDPTPTRLFLGRWIADSARRVATGTYSLKRRTHIATTSMDAELALVTANLALARPGGLVYDPFMGTGSFPLACAHFGAVVWGSDLDGRTIRGTARAGKEKGVRANFDQYGTRPSYLGGFIADLTNSPVRGRGDARGFLDAVVCDPPYGVREGLKVLGSSRAGAGEVVFLSDGMAAHLQEGYVPPKKPYSFVRMLEDILDFAAERVVAGGRVCMWMPVAGAAHRAEVGEESEKEGVKEVEVEVEEDYDYAIPHHPALRLVSMCRQDFNKWSRRLLTYTRRAAEEVEEEEVLAHCARRAALSDGEDGANVKVTADDLNAFRKKYFQGFKDVVGPA